MDGQLAMQASGSGMEAILVIRTNQLRSEEGQCLNCFIAREVVVMYL